jgi:hypothetical protein
MRILVLVVVAAACQRDSATPAAVDDLTVGATTSLATTGAQAAQSNATGTTGKAAARIEGLPVEPGALIVGDCFNRYAGLQNYQPIEIITKRPCEQTHDAEVFYKNEFAGSVAVNTYPGKEKLTTDSIQVCYDNFSAFVGRPYETSNYQLGYFVPPQDRWESTTARDRSVICYVTAYTTGTKLTGTVRDSRL